MPDNPWVRYASHACNALMLGLLALALCAPLWLFVFTSSLGRHTELGCMALNIYREARDEGRQGKFATGISVLNRLHVGFRQAGQAKPESLCDVIWAPHAYSWTQWRHNEQFTVALENLHKLAYSVRAAMDVLNNTPDVRLVWEVVGVADHYHAVDANPSWNKEMEVVAQVGRHIFYVDRSRFEPARRKLEKRLALINERKGG